MNDHDYLWKIHVVWTQFNCVSKNYIKKSELNIVLLHKEFEFPTLHSIFSEILKFMSSSEVAHRSFCIKFSGLISELRILEKKELEILTLPRIFFLIFSFLQYFIKVTLHFYFLSHPFEIHSALELSPTALLCCRLAKTRGCPLAITKTKRPTPKILNADCF